MAKRIRTALFANNQPGGMFSIEDMSLTTGNRFFVDSGSATAADSVGSGRGPDTPFATLAYALSSDVLTASNGDIVYVMPGHEETLSGEADIAVDIDGVHIQGIGWEGSKPLLNIDTEHTEAAPILISADGCVLDNFKLLGINAGGSKVAIEITGDNTRIANCDFRETSTDTELGIGEHYGIITLLDTGGAIDEVIIEYCTFYGLAGHDESFLSVTNSSNGATNVTMRYCDIIGTFADGCIQGDQGTNVNTKWYIHNCRLGSSTDVITMDTSAVWYLSDLIVFGIAGANQPIVGYTASFMNNIQSCEPGAYSANTLTGSVSDFGS